MKNKRHYFTLFVKAIAVVLVLLVIIILALQIDDDLDSEVQSLFKKSQSVVNSDAYFYLMGIYAAESEEPIKIGQKIYQSIAQGEETYLTQQKPFEYYHYPDELKLLLPEGDLFCSYWEKGCIDLLFQESPTLGNLLKNNALLLLRYHHFNLLNDYSTLTGSMSPAPFPPYQYIARASRLVVLNSIKKAKSSNYKQAIDILSNNISNLRKQLARQDTLIGKVFFLMQISENIDIFYLIQRNSKQQISIQLSPLTNNEKDFEVLMAKEFSGLYAIYKKMEDQQDFWGIGKNTPNWAIKTIFKPNMTLNAIFPVYKQAIDYAALSHTEFAIKIAANNELKIPESYLRNSVGTLLNQISIPNYKAYIGRFFDLDSKITLFNSAINSTDIKSIVGSIINPYYDSNHSAYLSKNNKSICFEGPLPDERNLRCLRIKI